MDGKRLYILFVFVIVLGLQVDAGEAERIGAIKKISAGKWNRVAAGLEPWPVILFPLSHWSKAEKSKLPGEYWKRLEKCEKEWPAYISTQRSLFKKEYGSRYKNIYDLFLKEQSEMRQRGYSAARPPVAAKKTLRRLIDVAYLQAKYFRETSGTPVENFRLLAYRNGRLRVIPFDILEFTEEGRVVLPEGPASNPGEADGMFRNNDRLFFLTADAGHRVGSAYISKKFPSVKKIDEVEIFYKREGEQGWVYAASFDGAAPEISLIDYVVFHPDYSIFYTPFGYNQCEPRYMDDKIVPTLKISTWCSSPAIGAIPYDIHERLRVRITLKYILGSTHDDEDCRNVSWRAWFQGRVINYNRVVFKVSTPLGIGAPVVFDDVVVSPFSVYNYINWRTPFDPSIIMKYLDVIVGEELNERVLKFKDILKVQYITEKDRKGYSADGQMTEAEKKRDSGYCPWHLYTCLVNTVCMRTDYDDFMKKHSKMTLDWRDNGENIGNYDNHLVMENFKRRNHHFFVEWNAVPFFWNENPAKYNWKSLDTVLKRIDKPLSYRVSGSEMIKPGPIVHIPNIKKEQDKYDF